MDKKILWVSRHAPFEVARQIETLQAMFGADCEVVHRDIGNSQAVAREFQGGGYADLVCVVPMATLDHICREGLTPLWADMVETATADGRKPDLQFAGRKFWFTGYRRVMGVSLDLVQVDQTDAGRVLRVTRHVCQAEELAALRQAFGNSVAVLESPQPIRDGREVIERLRRLGADECLVVAPYSVYDQLVKQGVRPLYAKVDRGRFRSLHRIVGVQIEFEDV